METQRLVSYFLLVVFGPIIHGLYHIRFRYSAHDLKAVRARFAAIRRDHPGPILLCTNHLTLIDSIVQGVILNSLWRYCTRVSALPWNLPERKNFDKSLSWRLTCYLGRCIPVTRGASQEESKRVQQKMSYVLNRGDIISIFPEGTRSRSSRVDTEEFSYGSGQLLRMVPDATVLCVYLRGMKHGLFSDFPATGEHFFVDLEVIRPESASKGMRQARDFSRQIVQQLATMEQRYFDSDLAPR
ncbi:MAG: 1-acyl-sn-glycerol-3-phosphate acyltransferase [Gammaproteobacteria bacterium]